MQFARTIFLLIKVQKESIHMDAICFLAYLQLIEVCMYVPILYMLVYLEI